MLRGLLMSMTMCLAGAMCAPTQAAFVVFSGTFSNVTGTFGSGFGNNQATLTAFFTGNAGVASITSAVLTAGNGGGLRQWSFGPGGTLEVGNFANDYVEVIIPANGVDSAPGGTSFGGLDLTLNAPGTDGHVVSSDWQTIYNSAEHGLNGSSVSGNISLGGKIYNFTGAAVPEPGSIALLSGLGLVFGAVRRRRQTRATAV